MKPIASHNQIFISGLILFSILVCGCDGVSKNETSQIAKFLGNYNGAAQPKRIMGAMMTGKWSVSFVQDENGILKCECTCRLHDEFHGWGEPETETVNIKWYTGSNKSDKYDNFEYVGEAMGEQMKWTVRVCVPSLKSGQTINAITLIDQDYSEITLNRTGQNPP